MANNQVAFGRVSSVNGATLFKARVSENLSSVGTSTESTNSARTGETAEVVMDAAGWATKNGTAAAGTTLYCPAGVPRYFPELADGDTISVVSAGA